MTKNLGIGLFSSGMLLASLSTYAEVRIGEVKDTGDSTFVLGEIKITAPKTGPLLTRNVLSSVDILASDRIENQNVFNSWELLGQMPGVQLTQFKQGAESGKPSFRGFNGEGEINAVKLLIDGIPSNTNDGNMRYMDMVFPLDLDGIEVVRGTNDPRYGLHNIAGNINMLTKQGGNYVQGRASYGSFNTAEGQLSVGIENGGFAQNYSVAVQGPESYRQHGDTAKYNLAGKWFFTPENQKFKVGIIARHYLHEADEPGYLTFDQAHADPQQSMPHNAFDGERRDMSQLSGHLDWALTDTLSLSTKAYFNRIDSTRWVKFSAAQSQQERVTKENHTGVLSSLTWRPQVSFLHSFALEGGISSEWQDNESLRYTTANRVRSAKTRDQQFDFDTTGGYIQAIIQPVASLKLIPAYRVESIDGQYTNRLNGSRYNINDYGLIHQPKFSLVFSPAEGYSLYGNWGRSFQVGVGTASYRINQASDLEPSINEGWEVGVKFKPFNWLDGRLAGWEQEASNEARRKLGDAANDSENIGKTLRNGVDLQLNVRPTDKTKLWAAYSWQQSQILQADKTLPNSQGKEIDHVPHYLISGGAEYQPTPKWKLGLLARAQGNAYLERENTKGAFGQYLIFDASVNYQLNDKVNLDLQVKNLADSYYEYVWWNTTSSLHAPGDGRSAYISVNFKL
ncbi:MAG: TonB-dependent receptor [Methylophilaceae bacterium]